MVAAAIMAQAHITAVVEVLGVVDGSIWRGGPPMCTEVMNLRASELSFRMTAGTQRFNFSLAVVQTALLPTL